jgi:biuret amidohydrolase
MTKPALEELVCPGSTALVLQEVQNGIVGQGSALPLLAEAAAQMGVTDHAARLVTAARAAGVTVIHATAETLPGGFGANVNAPLFAGARKAGVHNAPGSAATMPVPEVHPGNDAERDVLLPRYHGLSPMTGSPLDSLLRNAGIGTVVVAGVSLNVAIPNLVFDAVNRAYQVVVVADAVAGVPVEYGLAVLENCLQLVATIARTDDLVAIWSD